MELSDCRCCCCKLRLDKAADRLRALEGSWDGDAGAALADAGLEDCSCSDASLGTSGGGNHFCELQAIEEIVEPSAAAMAGLDRSQVFVLVHSGSRRFGHAILERQLIGRCSTP